VTLTPADADADPGRVAVDAAGNAFAVWNLSGNGEEIAQASRYSAATGTWSPVVTLASLGEDGENVSVAVDGPGNAVVTFLFDNDDDSGEIAQATEWVAASSLPGPTDLHVVAVDGNTVTLGWSAPVGGAAPDTYAIEGGLTPGEVLASIPTGSSATRFTFVAPTGTFYVRALAIAGGVRTAPSNEIHLFVNVPAVPAAPQRLNGAALGTTLNLDWRRGEAGGAPQQFLLEVTGSIATALVLPGGARSFAFSGVPPGTYTFSLRAMNSAGVSEPSGSLTLTFPTACAAPTTPSGLRAVVVGGEVTLAWAAGSGYASSYWIEAGSAPGLSDLAAIDSGSAMTSFSATAPPGTYYVRARALNACGASAPSSEIVVTVGG
jgi:hypothetical protein